jgi:hypothetical protein
VQIPIALSERLPILDRLEDDWEPMPRKLLYFALAVYAALLWDIAHGGDPLGLVFLPVHEGGHLIFSWFGQFISVAGGTFTQLAVPFLLAAYFAFQRKAMGAALCLFFFFQQFLPIATYMADARTMELPLVSVGSGDVIHDWNYLFGHLGLLDYDTRIAGTMRIVGWIGMLCVVAWLAWRGFTQSVDATRNPHP